MRPVFWGKRNEEGTECVNSNDDKYWDEVGGSIWWYAMGCFSMLWLEEPGGTPFCGCSPFADFWSCVEEYVTL